MRIRHSAESAARLSLLHRCGLITEREAEAVNQLDLPSSPFARDVELAETVHLHIKVDDTHQLPINEFFDAGARLDHQKDGFVKYRFPGAINAIFSHIKVSQDELLETESNRRPRPFLDHIGIDLREESDLVRQAFDALPDVAVHFSGLWPRRAVRAGPCTAVTWKSPRSTGSIPRTRMGGLAFRWSSHTARSR